MSFATVVGRLGRDAELRSGNEPSKSVLNFSVAEDIGYGDKKRTQWWSCALWGKRAESIAAYLTKGTPVTVVGNPELREYEKRDKSMGAELTLRVIDVHMQGRGGEKQESTPSPAAATAPAGGRTSAQVAADADFPEFDDDKTVPF